MGRKRNLAFLLVFVGFVLVSLLLYTSLEANSQRRRQFLNDGEVRERRENERHVRIQVELSKLELRLKQLEEQLHANDAIVRDLQDKIKQSVARREHTEKGAQLK
jgi:hypothetical protein